MPSINSNSKILSKSVLNASTTLIQKPAIKCALITLVNAMELHGFDHNSKLQLAINVDEFKNRYQCLFYTTYLRVIQRKPCLEDTINDILQIFPFYEIEIIKFLKKHEEKPEKVITFILRTFPNIMKIINFALIIDAAKNFYCDKSRLTFLDDYLSKIKR